MISGYRITKRGYIVFAILLLILVSLINVLIIPFFHNPVDNSNTNPTFEQNSQISTIPPSTSDTTQSDSNGNISESASSETLLQTDVIYTPEELETLKNFSYQITPEAIKVSANNNVNIIVSPYRNDIVAAINNHKDESILVIIPTGYTSSSAETNLLKNELIQLGAKNIALVSSKKSSTQYFVVFKNHNTLEQIGK